MAIDLLTIEPNKVSKSLNEYIHFIYGPPKVGKAQPVETVIPTPDGNRMLGDIKVGDYVYARNGKPTKVLGVFPQGKMDTYLITLDDGRQTECAGTHLWGIYADGDKGSNSKTDVHYRVVTTQEMFEHGPIREKIKNNNTNWFMYKIPKCEAIEKTSKDYPIDPYLLGVCLSVADTTQKYFTLKTQRDALIDEVGYILNAIPNINPNDIREVNYIKNGKLLETEEVLFDYLDVFLEGKQERRIPEEFFEGSITQRLNMVQGFADSLGTIYNEKGQTVITRLPKILTQDLQKLFYTLGYKVRMNQMRSTDYEIDSGLLFNLTLTASRVDEKKKIFRTYERKNIYSDKIINYDFRISEKTHTITNIEKLNIQKEMVCIYVEDEEHLYLTNDYIVTHNTTLASQIEGSLLLASK